jgi:hypothetical protein
VEWRGHNQTFRVDPRDLTNDQVLKLEMELSPPQPGGLDLFDVSLLIITLIIVIGVLVWRFLRQTKG